MSEKTEAMMCFKTIIEINRKISERLDIILREGVVIKKGKQFVPNPKIAEAVKDIFRHDCS